MVARQNSEAAHPLNNTNKLVNDLVAVVHGYKDGSLTSSEAEEGVVSVLTEMGTLDCSKTAVEQMAEAAREFVKNN